MNVVLIHGFGENSTIWEDFIKLLDSSNKYFLFDYSNVKETTSMNGYAKFLEDYVNAYNLETFVLIGHSMGGYIALEYISSFNSNNVLGLGLFHSTAAADTEQKKLARDKTIDFIEKNGSEVFIDGFYGGMFADSFHDKALIERNKTIFRKISKEALVSATKAIRDRKDHTELLNEFEFPVFQIIGQLDTFIDPEKVLEQSLNIINPGILLIPDVAHAGMYENPNLCSMFINKFLTVC